MERHFYLATLIGVAVLFSPPGRAQSTASTKLPNSFDINAIDTFLNAEIQKKWRVGLSVAIVKDGTVVLAKGYGNRSLEPRSLVETNTLFAIGSVTKQFVCACTLKLAEDGKLSVHEKVSKWYPKLTQASKITLLDLMSHTSGYPDYYPLDFVDRRMLKPATADEVIEKYATGKLDFEPGSNWSYSNTGFIILGRVIEKVSGKPLGEFLRTRIFKPLHMDHTAYEPEPSDSRLATGYTSFLLSESESVAPEAKGWAGAAGGIYSTPLDLAKWDMALIGGKMLKPESLRLMTSPRTLSTGKISDYGCGLNVRTQEKRTVLDHGGAVSGFSTWNAIVPSLRAAVIVIANRDSGLPGFQRAILNLMLKEENQSNVPKISGLSASDATRKIFGEIQSGKVNRASLADEFSWYLTPERLAAASQRLKDHGAPQQVTVMSVSERGGLEVSSTRLSFNGKAPLKTLMYRRTDGIVEQFFVDED